mmetsp:Transcript_26795/g.39644  ORF Transcript_26795/g.39644 Transcript_26795/m.39644 type:complete len:95 (+) Transcript_26795:95-379(+)
MIPVFLSFGQAAERHRSLRLIFFVLINHHSLLLLKKEITPFKAQKTEKNAENPPTGVLVPTWDTRAAKEKAESKFSPIKLMLSKMPRSAPSFKL